MRKRSLWTAGADVDAVVNAFPHIGMILDVTHEPRMRESDRRKIIRTLASWRDWAETDTGNALKLTNEPGAGRQIDVVVRKFRVSVSLIVRNVRTASERSKIITILRPHWDRAHTKHLKEIRFVLRNATRANPTMAIDAPDTEIASITYTENDNKRRWLGWMPEDEHGKQFAIMRQYHTVSGYWSTTEPLEVYYFDIRKNQLVMPEDGRLPFGTAVLAQEMYARLRKRRKPARRDW